MKSGEYEVIKRASVKDFKCFNSINVSLDFTTLLLGTNSGGKSSFIQSVLLSKMIIGSSEKINLINNIYGINFGAFEDVINVEAENTFSFNFENEEDEELMIECTIGEDSNILNTRITGNRQVLKEDIIYLSAERNISKIQMAGDLSKISLGKNNEHLAYIIDKGKTKGKVPYYKKRNYWNNTETQLLDIQINDWLNFILPSNNVSSLNFKYDQLYSLQFGDNTRAFRQSNVGFGVSFILPIIIAGLIAKPNSILIIENPELHLHPKAQSNMSAFLSTVASDNVQVIIETHSDHIVNGFRKAMLSKDIELTHNDIEIKYFDNSNGCEVQEISLNMKAEIENWPVGFMDQSEEDLFEIRKMRRQ